MILAVLLLLTLVTWATSSIVLTIISCVALPIQYKRQASIEVLATAIGITIVFWLVFSILSIFLN